MQFQALYSKSKHFSNLEKTALKFKDFKRLYESFIQVTTTTYLLDKTLP